MHDRSRKANDPGVGYRAVTRQMKEQDGGGVGGLPKRFKKKKKKNVRRVQQVPTLGIPSRLLQTVEILDLINTLSIVLLNVLTLLQPVFYSTGPSLAPVYTSRKQRHSPAV